MAFFKKLKDRLFKSSSKIDEGLEAIVSDGGTTEEAVDAAVEDSAQAAAEVAKQAAEREAQQIAAEEAAQVRAEAAARAQAEARAEAEAEARAEAAARAKEAAEAEAAAREAREAEARAQAARAAQAAAEESERQQAVEAARAAEAAAHAAKEAQAKQVAEAAEAARAREIQQQAAEAARAEQQALEAAQATAQEQPAVEPLRTTIVPVTPSLEEEEPSEPAPKRGILGRLMGRGTSAPVTRRVLDDAMLEQLEELLITADMGVDTALRVTANMAEGRLGKKLSVQEIKTLMSDEIARIMEPVAKPLPLYAKTPQVVLVVGVNGSGKTTTIGKLASQFRAAGKKVVIAAGDTFRAAAVEQLQVWGERAGVPVLTAPQGSDPASLAFDAMVRAEADGADLLMIDTAGRLQNRGDLMEELAKIVRVIRKKDPDAPHNTLLVLDATTGQNAVNQVKVFQEISDVSGLVMTKLDGTAKGGVLVALADKFGLPIHAIGVGEQIDDLQAFDPQEFADALTGLDR
ncbi:signal recognition particle-docking protein FtsY [uncultured Sulfitobacter sp.]|uniref:signal recognition particle-docking protein FtsY n=1 Tax=uncultured Sulfitobacter sp. TaxID=191468 RepID=UPI002623DE7E|nr:signal recognition particle-docking protein FtsY [uncultured Sulfitobacter sp.]